MFGLSDAIAVQIIASAGALTVALVGFVGALTTVRKQKEPVAVEMRADDPTEELRRLQDRCADLEQQVAAWRELYLEHIGDRRKERRRVDDEIDDVSDSGHE